MRIALFSDIHANLPALNACLHSIEDQKPDAICCLGDQVGYKETVQVEFVRFDYDIEKTAKAIKESPLPDAYAEMLRKGY